MTKIGDTLYCYDINKRVYVDGQHGADYAGHFVPKKIIGETKFSWICEPDYRPSKVNKKTLWEAGKGGYMGHQWHTEQSKSDAIWTRKHRHKIRDLLLSADIDKLKQIAEILGYEE